MIEWLLSMIPYTTILESISKGLDKSASRNKQESEDLLNKSRQLVLDSKAAHIKAKKESKLSSALSSLPKL